MKTMHLPFLVLDLGLDVVNGIGRLKGGGLAGDLKRFAWYSRW